MSLLDTSQSHKVPLIKRSAPKSSAEVIAALYTLIYVLLEMSCEDQSLSHRRPKEVVAHWILQSSSLSSRQSSVTVLPRYLKERTFARWVMDYSPLSFGVPGSLFSYSLL